MIDSGANISIAKRELAEKMGVTIRKVKEKIKIQFGKEGARSEAIGYANFGELIGDVAIVEDASDTLIHIKTFTDKGMRVVFDGDKVQIVDEEGEIVIQGQCDESQLYYIDIEEAMRISIEYGHKKRKKQEAIETGEIDRKVMGLSSSRTKAAEEKEKESIWGIEEEEKYESEEGEEVEEGGVSDKNNQEQEVTERSEQQGEKEKSRTRKRKSTRGERVSIEQQRYIWKLHRQCNHMSENVMCESIQQWGGIPEWVTTAIIHKVFKRQHCIACEIAKRKTLPQQIGSGIKENVVGRTLSADYVGPITPKTMGGANGFIIFKCTASGFRTLYLVKSKTAFAKCVNKVVNWWARKGKNVRKIRIDAGRVENSEEASRQIEEIARRTGGLEFDTAPPGSQEKNPIERDVQWIKRRVPLLLMEQSTLGASAWGYALLDIIDTENMAVNALSRELEEGMQTAYYCVYGHNPSMEQRKYSWGQLVTIQKQKTIGMEVKNVIGAAVGMAEGEGGGVRVVISGKGLKVYTRYQVKALKIIAKELTDIEKEALEMEEVKDTEGEIIETKYKSHVESGALDRLMIDMVHEKMIEEGEEEKNTRDKGNSKKDNEEEEKGEWAEDIEGWNGVIKHRDREEGNKMNSSDDEGDKEEEESDEKDQDGRAEEKGEETKDTKEKEWSEYTREEIDESVRTRDDRARRSRVMMSIQEEANDNIRQIIAEDKERHTKKRKREDRIRQIESPDRRVNKVRRRRTSMNPTIEEAMEHEWPTWQEAVQKEMSNILDEDVSEEVKLTDVPEGTYIGKTMVDLTTKIDKKTGEIKKRKCRINVRGDLEKKWNTKRGQVASYSPTARQQTIMLMIALGAHKGKQGYKLSGWDAEAAFLQTPAKRDIYIEFPKQLSEGRRKILKLKRMMYGMDDASREWFEYLKDKLVNNGYKQCINDPCAFVKREEEEVCIVAVHVDDGTDLCNSDRLRDELYGILEKHFKITKQECLESQLGMTLEYNEDGSITVIMPVHIRKVIEEVYPEGTAIPIATTPMSEKWNEAYQRDAERCDIERWMMILGMVVWILRVRLDIACAVSILCSRTQEATTRDMEALERIVAYLAFTEKIGVTFHPEVSEEEKGKEWVEQTGYADAAVRAYMDDSQAQNGIATKLGSKESKSGMYMGSSAKNKSMVPLASTGAELAAAVEETKDVIWSRELLQEWGYNSEQATNVATKVMEDNKSLITIATDYSKGSKRMRQSLNLVHFLMDNIQRKNIEFVWLEGMEHPADGLSKPLRPKLHWRHMSKLMGEHPEIEKIRDKAGQMEGQTAVKCESYRKVYYAMYAEEYNDREEDERVEYERARDDVFKSINRRRDIENNEINNNY